jgi:hypothetical protein
VFPKIYILKKYKKVESKGENDSENKLGRENTLACSSPK